MKRFIVILVLALSLLLIPAFAQFEAGFLDSPAPGGGTWGGSGWYCIEKADPYDPNDDLE